jgi:hypothetical protein
MGRAPEDMIRSGICLHELASILPTITVQLSQSFTGRNRDALAELFEVGNCDEGHERYYANPEEVATES